MARIKGCVSADGRWSSDAPAQGRAIIAYALARSAEAAPEDGSVRSKAEAAVRQLFRETAPDFTPLYRQIAAQPQLAADALLPEDRVYS